MADTPNVLIFHTDQQRADVIHPDHPCQTPNVQRIIDEGVLFTNHYTQTAHCCPARASFMTGHYPSQHGVWNNILTNTRLSEGLNDGIRCFSEDLSEAGWDLAYTGKWHVSGLEDPADRGWRELATVTGRASDSNDSALERIIRAVEDEDPDRPREDGQILRPGWGNRHIYASRPDGGPKGYENLRDYTVTREAIDELPRLAEGDAPWMLYCGLIGPHDPFTIPEKFATMYDPDEIELPASFRDTLEDKPRVYQRMRHQYWGQMSEREVRESIAHYWGYCTMLDAMFGEVLDALEATGELDNTMVVFTSDHGDYCGDHGLYCKGVPAFDGAYKIPLAVRWPGGAQAGATCDEFTTHADMANTFREIAGCPEPDSNMPGRSIVPLLAGDTPGDWRDEMHLQFNGVEVYYTQRTVFTDEWKYVYNAFDFDELYDRREDPHEMHNLAAPCRNPIGHDNVPERRSPGEFQPWPELPPELNEVRREMLGRIWRFATERDDTIFNSYFTVALSPYGPACGG